MLWENSRFVQLILKCGREENCLFCIFLENINFNRTGNRTCDSVNESIPPELGVGRSYWLRFNTVCFCKKTDSKTEEFSIIILWKESLVDFVLFCRRNWSIMLCLGHSFHYSKGNTRQVNLVHFWAILYGTFHGNGSVWKQKTRNLDSTISKETPPNLYHY